MVLITHLFQSCVDLIHFVTQSNIIHTITIHMSLDHTTMTSVDLTSRLTVYKLTPSNKTTVNRLLFISDNFTAGSDNVLH